MFFQSKAKVTTRKAFLKRKDGMARLKKNKQKPLKDDSKHSGRAGLDCWGHFSQPVQVDKGMLQPREYSQFSLQVSGSMKIGTHEKKADNASAEWELNSQTDCEAKVVEQSLEEKQVIRRDEDTMKNPIGSPQRMWPEILQPSPETLIEMNLQVGEEKENHHTDSLGQAGRTDGRPVRGTLKKHLGRVDWPLKGHRTEGAKKPLEVLQKHSLLQDLKPNHIKELEWSADPVFAQGEKWVQVCTQELALGSQSSESKRQIHTGFKMVNDKIVKITHSLPEAVEKGSSLSALQQEWQTKRTAASAWHVASSSCESRCSSSNSNDDSKSHHAQYTSQNGPQGVDHTGRRLDISDGDYASDEPSGTKIKYVKKYSRSPPRKQDIQVISRQDFSCSTSSSDSSTGAARRKESKACSSLQQSLYYPTKLKRTEHEPESKNENRARDVKSLHLPSSALAGEIPAFKTKETPAVEEPQKKLFRDILGKCFPSFDLYLFYIGEKNFSWMYASFCLCSLGICPPLSIFLSPKLGKKVKRGEINLQAPCYTLLFIVTRCFSSLLLEVHFQVQTFDPMRWLRGSVSSWSQCYSSLQLRCVSSTDPLTARCSHFLFTLLRDDFKKGGQNYFLNLHVLLLRHIDLCIRGKW